MTEQMNIFECLYPTYQIAKPIRLIELFAGYGSQALALKYTGIPFEHWKICEWNYKSFNAYRRIHRTDVRQDFMEGKTTEDLVAYLTDKGVSADWNKPMTEKQVRKLNDSKLREIYNDIQATSNLVDISRVHAEDLEITDTDKYTYLMSYSFPCQDLSLAGTRHGMNRDSGTRSSLLYEVERILHECRQTGKMPEVLIMENVPMVHGADNTENWREWLLTLERLGYSNYWQDMIATDYGIPQIRNRTFCVSIQGEYAFNFPQPLPLEKKLRDLLEKKVSERYFLTKKFLNYCITNDAKQKELGNGFRFEPQEATAAELAKVINTHPTSKMHDNFIEVKTATKLGTETAYEYDGVDLDNRKGRRGVVQAGKAHTLQTNAIGVVVVKGNYLPSGHSSGRIVDEKGVYPTLRAETHDTSPAIQTEQLTIRKLTPRECFRLQGVRDDDIDKLDGLTDNTKYHLAGDSICTTVLMALFGELTGTEWQEKVRRLHGDSETV